MSNIPSSLKEKEKPWTTQNAVISMWAMDITVQKKVITEVVQV
jgi:hypothetical protein